jgi:hypothetical protein
MYSQHITMQIKKNVLPKFPEVIENEILPLLRRQKGFLEERILMAPNKTELVNSLIRRGTKTRAGHFAGLR